MEKLEQYSLLDDQGNLVRVSSHGPSIDDIEINSVKSKKVKNEKKKLSIVRFEFHEIEEERKFGKRFIKKINSKSLNFFGELKNINFIFSERRYTKNIHIEMNMETEAALNAMRKFKKEFYMCAKILLPGEKSSNKKIENLNNNKLRKIYQFSISRIFGDKARVKIVVAQ